MRRWWPLPAGMFWGTSVKPGLDVVVRRWRYTTDSHGRVEARYWTRPGRHTTFSRYVRCIIEPRMEEMLTRAGSSSTVTSVDITVPRSTRAPMNI